MIAVTRRHFSAGLSNMKRIIAPVILLACVTNGLSLREHPPGGVKNHDNNVGDTLYLTPLINKGRLHEAKKLSKVGYIPADREVTGFSGYLTVNPEYNSNLFFWFVPSLVSGNLMTQVFIITLQTQASFK